jgi:hypothetical protein
MVIIDFTYKDESTVASSNVENNKKEEGAPVVNVNVTSHLLQVNWAKIADEQDMNHRHQEPAVVAPMEIKATKETRAPLVPCKYGSSCIRKKCWYGHPKGHVTKPKSQTPCLYGSACIWGDKCWYKHPAA